MNTQPDQSFYNQHTTQSETEIISTPVKSDPKGKVAYKRCNTYVSYPSSLESLDSENDNRFEVKEQEDPIRSQSHMKLHKSLFMHSPKPKPKPIKICISPMKLKNTFLNSNESDHCISAVESENESEHDNSYQTHFIIREIRKEMGRIKGLCKKEECKEYNYANISRLSLKDIKPKTVFAKTIKGFLDDEKMILKDKNALRKSYGAFLKPKTFSILDVLEFTVYNNQLELVKSKSTLL